MISVLLQQSQIRVDMLGRQRKEGRRSAGLEGNGPGTAEIAIDISEIPARKQRRRAHINL